MCGIAGLMAKGPGCPVAPTLASMLQALRRRGPDSTGVSLYGAPFEGDLLLSVWAGEGGGESARAAVLGAVEGFATVKSEAYEEGYFRVGIVAEDATPDTLGKLTYAIGESSPGVLVFSIGRSLALTKAFGDESRIHAVELPAGHARAWTK